MCVCVRERESRVSVCMYARTCVCTYICMHVCMYGVGGGGGARVCLRALLVLLFASL